MCFIKKMIVSVLRVNGMDKYTSFHLSRIIFGSPQGTVIGRLDVI